MFRSIRFVKKGENQVLEFFIDVAEIEGNLFFRKFLCDQPQLLIFGFGSVWRVFSEIIDQRQPDLIGPYLRTWWELGQTIWGACCAWLEVWVRGSIRSLRRVNFEINNLFPKLMRVGWIRSGGVLNVSTTWFWRVRLDAPARRFWDKFSNSGTNRNWIKPFEWDTLRTMGMSKIRSFGRTDSWVTRKMALCVENSSACGMWAQGPEIKEIE